MAFQAFAASRERDGTPSMQTLLQSMQALEAIKFKHNIPMTYREVRHRQSSACSSEIAPVRSCTHEILVQTLARLYLIEEYLKSPFRRLLGSVLRPFQN